MTGCDEIIYVRGPNRPMTCCRPCAATPAHICHAVHRPSAVDTFTRRPLSRSARANSRVERHGLIFRTGRARMGTEGRTLNPESGAVEVGHRQGFVRSAAGTAFPSPSSFVEADDCFQDSGTVSLFGFRGFHDVPPRTKAPVANRPDGAGLVSARPTLYLLLS